MLRGRLELEGKRFGCSCSTQKNLNRPFAMQQFLNRFIKLNMEEKKDLDLDLMIVVVDDLNKTYTEISRLPMAASRSPAPLKGKNAKECFEILKKLKKDTGSEINVKNFAVLDGRSVEDDIVLLVQAFEKTGEIKTVRAALKETDMALVNLWVGNMNIEEFALDGTTC